MVFRNSVVLVTQGACQKIKSLNLSAEVFDCAPPAGSTSRDRGRQLDAQVLFTAAWGRKQADVNEGWRFHEAQLVDGRFNVTGLNWAMIRTVCKIHFLAGLCPPAPSSKRSSPSPSSYAFECNKNWTMLCCARFRLTTITFWIERGVKKKKQKTFFLHQLVFFLSSSYCKVSIYVCCKQREWCLKRHVWMPSQLRLFCSTICVCLLWHTDVFLACATNVTCFHAMCQANRMNFLSVSLPCCSCIKQPYILKSNLFPEPLWCFSFLFFSLFLFPLLDWIVVYRSRNATSARSIRLWHIKQQSLYYKEHAVIVSGVLGVRWEPGIFFLSSLDREAHMVLCGLNF